MIYSKSNNLIPIVVIFTLLGCGSASENCKIREEIITSSYPNGLTTVSNCYFDEFNNDLGLVELIIENGDTTDITIFENIYSNDKIIKRIITSPDNSIITTYLVKEWDESGNPIKLVEDRTSGYTETLRYEDGQKVYSQKLYNGELFSEFHYTWVEENLVQINSKYMAYSSTYEVDSMRNYDWKYEYLKHDENGKWINRSIIFLEKGDAIDTTLETRTISYIDRPCDKKFPGFNR